MLAQKLLIDKYLQVKKNKNNMKEKVNKNTEAAILEAAESLFKTNGFKGTTTTMIAGQAGVTHAMLHYYFRTKEQIFVTAIS